MPDKDLEILIKTEAELSGAKAAEEQLERDINQARALGAAYEELESRLKRVREAMAGLPQTAQPGNATGAKTDDAPGPGRKYHPHPAGRLITAAGKPWKPTHRRYNPPPEQCAWRWSKKGALRFRCSPRWRN